MADSMPEQADPKPAVHPSKASVHATLELLGQQAEQTFGAIIRRIDARPSASMREGQLGSPSSVAADAVAGLLRQCHQGLAPALQAALALQQLDLPTPRHQALAERGALQRTRAAAVEDLLRHCLHLVCSTGELLRCLNEDGATPRGAGEPRFTDAAAPTILLAGACSISFTLSLLGTVPVDVPYLEWFSRSTRAMLVVMQCGEDSEQPSRHASDRRLVECSAHAALLVACCTDLCRLCQSDALCQRGHTVAPSAASIQ